MKCVLVSGLSGGAGATTVAANLAAALQSMGQPSFSVDLDPANILGLHYGLEPLAEDGWAARMAAGEAVGEGVFRSADGRLVLPYGYAEKPFDSSAVLTLAKNLVRSEAVTSQCDWLIIDLPFRNASNNPTLLEGLRALADFELRVADTNPATYIRLRRRESSPFLAEPAALLINNFAPERKLCNDMLLTYKHEYGEQLAPLHIHRDPALPESLACLKAVMAYSPFTQAAADFRSLAIWVSAELAEAE
ncbi:cellulose biosynthesis protein BcsQ [Spongiibacter taiwanensis]|uniref:cellulose biosynthesis protein BcsQ n=1 Tax=Spongiibacter taiwanensis TaxID=1748242 RepID=UPI0020352FBE|nr:cellulose biosynthesis protein BcsQ [Spongiibacter taiwanensis]USA42929.1 cellulose biosynthesis protein BcsQ [Spongiibacter taiwanensis]